MQAAAGGREPRRNRPSTERRALPPANRTTLYCILPEELPDALPEPEALPEALVPEVSLVRDEDDVEPEPDPLVEPEALVLPEPETLPEEDDALAFSFTCALQPARASAPTKSGIVNSFLSILFPPLEI